MALKRSCARFLRWPEFWLIVVVIVAVDCGALTTVVRVVDTGGGVTVVVDAFTYQPNSSLDGTLSGERSSQEPRINSSTIERALISEIILT